MKIKKKSNSVGLVGNVTNEYSNSKQDSYGCDFINKLNGKILWTNPNPESEFASQNITLSSDDYDELIWYFISDIEINEPLIITATTLKKYGVQAFFNSSADLKFWARRIHYKSDAIYNVTDCKLIDSTGATGANTLLVPLYVIGRKTGLFN